MPKRRERLKAQAVFSSSAGPDQAEDGDAELVLDDGSTLRVHATLLALNSSVMKDVVSLAQAGERSLLRIPAPSTTLDEARALTLLLYSKRQESYIVGLPLAELLHLSSICHRFHFEDVLGLVDSALARNTGGCCTSMLQPQAAPKQYLTPENFSELYWDARCKGLSLFQNACAIYNADHMAEIAEAAPTDALGPVLVQAAKRQRQMKVQLRNLQCTITRLEDPDSVWV